jgi:hypothetical protein
MVAGVGDRGAIAKMFKSMMAPPWGAAEASYHHRLVLRTSGVDVTVPWAYMMALLKVA